MLVLFIVTTWFTNSIGHVFFVTSNLLQVAASAGARCDGTGVGVSAGTVAERQGSTGSRRGTWTGCQKLHRDWATHDPPCLRLMMARSLIILRWYQYQYQYQYIYIYVYTYHIKKYIYLYIYTDISYYICQHPWANRIFIYPSPFVPPTPPPLQALRHRGQEVAISAGRPVQTCGAAGSQAAPAGHGERCHEGGDPAAWGVKVSKCPHVSRCFAGSICFVFSAWFWPQAYKSLFGGWVWFSLMQCASPIINCS